MNFFWFSSRISEIIRQYNENQLQKSSSFPHDYESNDESVIAPPPLASGLEAEGGGASVDSNEVSSLDEDWLLQKSLEKKRGCKRTSGLKKVSFAIVLKTTKIVLFLVGNGK